MFRLIIFLMLLLSMPQALKAKDLLDSLEMQLRNHPQIQEKVYVHTDNTCYFLGDTLWYKAYVVRADDMKPTNMSKILYVELLTPDGFLVKRHQVELDDSGSGFGQFELGDSLFSGYYELRAYTKWQLNFNVTQRRHSKDDVRKFYSVQYAKDFYREFEGLYSRVFPIYEKPGEAGNYSDRFMKGRPRQRAFSMEKNLNVTFLPEGGNCIVGVPCQMAFEIKDESGKALDLEGTLSDGTKIKPVYEGRGKFSYIPSSKGQKANFVWEGENYTFDLPKAESTGLSMTYDYATGCVTVCGNGVTPSAYSVSCRGKLRQFHKLNGLTDSCTFIIDKAQLPTGVNDIVVYGQDAKPYTSRLFFVNNREIGTIMQATLNGDATSDSLAKYAKADITIEPGIIKDSLQVSLSVAVRDMTSDFQTYDTGNILADMLLGSELKGFIPNVYSYFDTNDSVHQYALDLLMMVQGWRRYKHVETLRYSPEKYLVFSGTVNRLPNIFATPYLHDVIKDPRKKYYGQLYEDPNYEGYINKEEYIDIPFKDIRDVYELGDYSDYTWNTVNLEEGYGNIKKEALVNAEIVLGTYVEKQSGRTMNGRFSFPIPEFYGQGVLFLNACALKDSLKYAKGKLFDGWMDATDYPEYYVKRDMFYPVFCEPYSWYQVNEPMEELADGSSVFDGQHLLQEVLVKKRRGKRGLSFVHPVYVRDIYDLYNEATDYGISWGMYSAHMFPAQATTLLFGNMGLYRDIPVRAMAKGHSYFRNYDTYGGMTSEQEGPRPSNKQMYDAISLKRVKNVLVYTDYDRRNNIGQTGETHTAQVTFALEALGDNKARYTYRDRYCTIDGYAWPREFYSPDYSHSVPTAPTDYRRTLYWNPNAKLAEDGTFTATFYGNSRECLVKVSAAGVGADGQLYYTE